MERSIIEKGFFFFSLCSVDNSRRHGPRVIINYQESKEPDLLVHIKRPCQLGLPSLVKHPRVFSERALIGTGGIYMYGPRVSNGSGNPNLRRVGTSLSFLDCFENSKINRLIEMTMDVALETAKAKPILVRVPRRHVPVSVCIASLRGSGGLLGI